MMIIHSQNCQVIFTKGRLLWIKDRMNIFLFMSWFSVDDCYNIISSIGEAFLRKSHHRVYLCVFFQFWLLLHCQNNSKYFWCASHCLNTQLDSCLMFILKFSCLCANVIRCFSMFDKWWQVNRRVNIIDNLIAGSYCWISVDSND